MHIKNNTNVLNIRPERSFIDITRREQIVHTSIELIAEEGYGRCSFARIARRGRISIGVIAYHFANKDELIEQIVKSVYEMAAAHMLSRMEAGKSPLYMLRTYIESNVEFIVDHPREMLALSEIFPNYRDENGRLHYDLLTEEPVLSSLKGLLRWGQETGEFRSFDLHVMAVTIRRAIDAIPAQAFHDGNFDGKAYANELAALFETAVCKK